MCKIESKSHLLGFMDAFKFMNKLLFTIRWIPDDMVLNECA